MWLGNVWNLQVLHLVQPFNCTYFNNFSTYKGVQEKYRVFSVAERNRFNNDPKMSSAFLCLFTVILETYFVNLESKIQLLYYQIQLLF